MDASLAQSAIVWAALGIGLASVLYCVFSGTPPLTSAEEPEEAAPPTNATSQQLQADSDSPRCPAPAGRRSPL